MINNKKSIVIDIPLLFEAKIQNLFDKIIVVKCDKQTQIKRILKKKKHTKTEINNIIKSQMPLKEKIKRSDFVVDNKTIKETEKQVNSIIDSIQKP
jgi:dephospho-CoA kinase